MTTMRAYTFREYIDRTPRQVWDVLVDLDVAPRWRPLLKSMETEDGQPLHAGSRVRLTIEYLGRRQTRTSTTVAFEAGRLWTLRSSDNPKMEGFFAVTLEPSGTGTEVTATCDLVAHGFVPWLFTPLIARSERRLRAETLGNLKRFVESTVPSGSIKP
jgi:carbon monoxide dehydrogenase subunit G